MSNGRDTTGTTASTQRDRHDAADFPTRPAATGEIPEALLQFAAKAGAIGVFERNLDTRKEWWSDETYTIFGQDPAGGPPEFGKGLSLVHPDDLPTVRSALDRVAAGGETSASYRFWWGAEIRHAEARYEPMREAGKVVGYRGTIVDVTDRLRAERERIEEHELLQTLVDTVDAAVIATDRAGMVTNWSGAAERLFGRSGEEALGCKLADLGIAEERDVDELTDAVMAGEQWDGILEAAHRDGTRFPIRARLRSSPTPDGHYGGILAVALDASERLQSRREIERARDHLRAVTDSMGEGLITLDSNGLVTYMNSAGEELLGWSQDDLVGENLHTAVHGRRADGSPYPIRESPISEVRRTGKATRVEADLFIRRDGSELDVAYTASPLVGEGEGTGVVVIFEDISDRRAAERRAEGELERTAWIGRVDEALDSDRMVAFAQPIIELDTGNVVKHELLVRMVEEDGSLVPPGLFLPAAEEHGLIAEIDYRMLEHAVRFADLGHAVTINLSAQTVATPDMAERLGAKITASGVDPSLLVIELTETAVIENEQAAKRFLSRISELGCRFALDDFGTGYGGFTYLKQLSVDFLKIDIEFVRDLKENAASKRVVAAVVQLARGFGQRTIAEGVEDDETAALLRSLGVDLAQGYLFGRPAPADEVMAVAGIGG